MSDLRTELEGLKDTRLDYVIARSKVNSDAQGIRDAGISSATFYSWDKTERETLNELAQRVKREAATRALMLLQDAAVEAAKIKIDGLKNRNDNIKQSSSTEILDRVLGKPTQRQELTGKDGNEVIFKVVYEDTDE